MKSAKVLFVLISFLTLFATQAYCQSGAGVFVVPSGTCANTIHNPIAKQTFCLQPGPPPIMSVWDGNTYVQSASGSTSTVTLPNSASGTTANKLAKLTGSSNAQVVINAAADKVTLGVVTSGAGTTGSATIQTQGLVSCVFDNGTTQGDFVGISSTIAGDCTDLGANPSQGGTIGLAAVSGIGPATYEIFLQNVGGSGTPQACTDSVTLAGGSGTFTNSCVTSTSYCACRDTTNNSNSCYPANPGTGSVDLTGNDTDTVQAFCTTVTTVPTSSGGGSLPINLLPSQSGNYNARGWSLSNLLSVLGSFFSTSASNPSQSGLVRDANNNDTVTARNADNTDDIPLIGSDSDDNVNIGGTTSNSIQLQNSAAVASGAFSSGAFLNVPTNSNSFTGGVETCANGWHNYTFSANSTVTMNCATTSANQLVDYNFIQPATGSTFTWTIASQAGSTILWPGGSAPTPCNVNGCVDQIEVLWTPSQNLYIAHAIALNLQSTGGGSNSCPTGYTCYYFSNSGGSDANTSTQAQSTNTPWQTVTKAVAQQNNLLGAAKAFLFKAGDTWTAQEFDLTGLTGSANNPIIIGSYGSGARPIFDENGANNYCFNQTGNLKYLTIQGFECMHSVYGAIRFSVTNSTSSVAGGPGLTAQNNYIHNTGFGCFNTNGQCLAGGQNESYDLDGQLMYMNSSACVNTPSECAGDGVHFLNNIVRWAGGHNTVRVHGDYGRAIISGNIIGPGCAHNCMDVKGVGTGTASSPGPTTMLMHDNITDEGASLGQSIGAGYYTENGFDANSSLEWYNNIAYDSTIGFQICSCNADVTAGQGSSCGSTNCNLHAFLYNNTVYSYFNGTGQYGVYGPYCTSTTACGTATLDVRNDIFDGSNFSYTGSRGPSVLLGEDHNDCGGSQGQPNWFTAKCNGAHDLVAVDPLFISPNQNPPNNANPPNFGLQNTSRLINAGQAGLVTGNTNIGAK